MSNRCLAVACWLLTSAIVVWCPWLRAQEQAATAEQPDAQQQADVQRWIALLGSESFAERRRAKIELQRMGLMAFDLLHEATFHDDSEVAIAARHLISSLQVRWAAETDPREVRELLSDYGVSANEQKRATRIQQLAELPDRMALAALCRLVRFESSLRLSRDAALLVMQQEPLPTEEQRRASAETIVQQIGANNRSSAIWLKAYAEDLRRDLYDAQRWRELIEHEQGLVDGRRSLQTDADAVLELVRVCAVRAKAAKNDDEAMRLAMETLNMVPPGRNASIEAVNWALDHQLYAVVQQMRQRQPKVFDREPLLLYAVAESHQALGEEARAAEIADAALSIDPVPDHDSAQAKQMSDDALENLAYRHQLIGMRLQQRGQFAWSIRELKQIVDALPLEMTVSAATRWELAQLHSQLGHHADVLRLLEPLQQRLITDRVFARKLSSISISVELVNIRLEQHSGLLAAEKGDTNAAQRHLERALQLSQRNADIAIAMYRLDGDQDWQEKVAREINSMTKMFEERILAEEQNYRQRRRATTAERLAEALNNYAWLVANTFGDQRRALRSSLRSLELSPQNPMYLDTCGRCYFALGQVQDAVKVQRRAAELAPERPEIQQQLCEFIAAAKQVENEASPGASGIGADAPEDAAVAGPRRDG